MAFPDKPFLLDLLAQIATRKKDEATARGAVARYKEVGDTSYYFYRLSRIDYAFSGLQPALRAAEQAVSVDPDPRFEVINQLANLRIEAGQLQEAEELASRIEKRYGNIKQDLRLSLQCRVAIARGRHREALRQSERIGNKSTTFYRKMRLDALKGEIRVSALPDDLRARYSNEISKLEHSLIGVGAEEFIPEEVDLGGGEL